MYSYLLVFIGGGLGSMCRFGIGHLLRHYNFHFPWATFSANALSCIILGMLVGLSLKDGMSPSGRFFLMTGFCGGFSTFSTFTNETYHLFLAGNSGYALANVALSALVCLVCLYAGMKMIL